MFNDENLIWIDLEMTGLDPEKNHILEIATIVTDKDLNIIAEGPAFAIYQSELVLAEMDAWCQKQHGRSGLTSRVKESNVTEKYAEKYTLKFLSQYIAPTKSPMCGNTVSQDRRFLIKYMPKLAAYFHYRHIDVSTLKELARRWAPQIAAEFTKESKHLALDDIKDSISELQYYREHFIQLIES